MNNPLAGQRVLVTRARDQASSLVELLHQRGAIAIEAPMIAVAPAEDYTQLDTALAQLDTYDWMIFTSVNTVRFVGERLAVLGRQWETVSCVRLCAVGPRTAAALAQHGLSVDFQPARLNGMAIADNLPIKGSERVLVAWGDLADRALAERLRQRGATVDEATAYRTLLDRTHEQEIRQLLERHEVDILTFASSSTVRNLADLLGPGWPHLLNGLTIACIGPVTAATARELGVQPQIISATATIEALVDTMEKELPTHV